MTSAPRRPIICASPASRSSPATVFPPTRSVRSGSSSSTPSSCPSISCCSSASALPTSRKYDVIIAPDMPRSSFSDATVTAVRQWVQRGGTFIATGSAARGVGAAVAEIRMRADSSRLPDSTRIARALRGREVREQDSWKEQVPGAILTVQLDPAHPLAFGAGVSGDPTRMFVLHSGAQAFEPDPAFESVGFFRAELQKVSGVISERNLDRLERSSWLAQKDMGSGRVILFVDDPIFRHFWYSGFQPFANAILIGPAM